jgi:hypothetical protein
MQLAVDPQLRARAGGDVKVEAPFSIIALSS